jgi:hypothetical protein
MKVVLWSNGTVAVAMVLCLQIGPEKYLEWRTVKNIQ